MHDRGAGDHIIPQLDDGLAVAVLVDHHRTERAVVHVGSEDGAAALSLNSPLMLSTPLAVKVRLAAVDPRGPVMVTFVTVVGVVLPAPSRVTVSELVVPGSLTTIDVTAWGLTNGTLVLLIVV